MHRLIVMVGLMLSAGAVAAGTVSGRVVDEATQLPIVGARMTVVSSLGGLTAVGPEVVTDDNGQYDFTFPLTGSQTQLIGIVGEAAGYAARQHDGRPCNSPISCAPGGNALTVTADTQHVIGFSLPRGAHLRGRVTDLVSGDPLDNATIELRASAIDGFTFSGSAQADTNGDFVIDGLHAGNYTLTARPRNLNPASGPLPYLDYVWPDLHCDNVQQSCAALPATPIAMDAGTDGGVFELRLKRGSVIRTRMLSLGDGSVVNQTTRVGAMTPSLGASAPTAGDGFAYVGPLLPGSVSLSLEPYAQAGYPAKVYPNLPCAATPCNLAGAPTIAIPEMTLVTTADVTVSPLRTISGRVTDEAGTPVAGITVRAGNVFWGGLMPWGFVAEASAVSGSDGSYQLEGMHSTQVIVRTTAGADNWIDSAWPDTRCNGENLFCQRYDATYTRIDFGAGATPASIDLRIARGTTLQGRVVDAATGLPKASWRVMLVPASSSLQSKPVPTDADGRFRFNGLTSEAFILAAAPSLPTGGGEGALYPDVPCHISSETAPLSCDLTAATAVTPSEGGVDNLVIRVPGPEVIFVGSFD
jgi:hypothetical protein